GRTDEPRLESEDCCRCATQAVGRSGNTDAAWRAGRLDDGLGKAVEGASLRRLVGLAAGGIAIADADQAADAGDLEADEVVRARHDPAGPVDDLDADHDKVAAVAGDAGTVGDQADGVRRVGGLATRPGDDAAAVEPERLDPARLI